MTVLCHSPAKCTIQH